MKVLHVVTSARRRGAELFAADLIRSLNDEAVSQRVAVLRDPGAEVLYEAPITWLAPDAGRARRRLGPAMRLRRLIGEWRPDIVQAHGGEALKYCVPAAAGRAASIVYRRIGAVLPWVPPGPRRRFHATLMRRAALVIAVAEAVRLETIDAFGIPPQRVVTIPNGVDSRRLEPGRSREEVRLALHIAPGAVVIASVGALTWEKDPLGQFEVAAGALEQVAGSVYLVVGDGPLRASLEGLGQRRGLDGRLIVLGNRPDVADLLAASDVVLLASRTEGMPACLIEGGMAGIPAAAYAVSGVSEVVADGVTGLLAAPGDQAGLVRRLVHLLESEAERRRMGGAARGRYRQRFDIGPIAGSYLDLYREVRGGLSRGR